ncbi:MAG: DUF1552 domain-containing protein [Deltaproteobacteria bacterium]|nr:DUF1552 domain-containing protein [Deltaproteobacteria bacterium]
MKWPLLSNWNSTPRTSRRSVLKAMGLAPALAPFVPLFDAFAETSPKRLLLWFTPHGTVYNKWRTSGPAEAPILGPIMAPLERHKKNIVNIENMQMNPDRLGGNHTKGFPLLWTGRGVMPGSTFGDHGWNYSASVDQVIVDALNPKTPYRSLEFGLRSGGSHPGRRMIYRGSAKPLEPEQDPQNALKRLFGNLGASKEQLEAMTADRRSLLDTVNHDLGIFKRKLAAPERYKLDAHLNAIREVEARISLQVASCAAPTIAKRVDAQSGPATPDAWAQQMDMIVASFACGLTNIASMQYRLGENDGSPYYTWLGGTMDHHTSTHEPPIANSKAWAHCEQIYTWYNEMFAKFLDKMSAVPEGNGTMLDNTLVVWGSEVGWGASHAVAKIPFIVAGGRNHGVRLGQSLRFGETLVTSPQHTRLLVSMCHYMGLPQIQSFSEKDNATGGLPGLMV